ncbi:uncharacterized protein LOC113757588 [Coffea eugenioides]|uniref:uncharacterized protein LOC113757588 n=1 Tax=Coffea eugenioides TaxID=49369 RepID=UPI000F610298|nr:uncharacterized protein LOC113757588 [Coffea eugenioides]
MAALRLPAGGRPPAHTVSSSFQGKSFSDLFKQNASQPSLSIAAETATHKGEPAILFSQATVDSLAGPYRFALVGKFPRGRPRLEEVRKFFSALDLREIPTVGLLDSRHVLIQLQTEADFHRVWFRRVWYVASAPMRVFKWTPGFHVDRESPIVPLWFQLPKLPLHFFHKEVLFQIMSCVGVPLLVDAATLAVSRPSVARVCVEVDLLRTLPSRVWIGNGDSAGFWQELEVEFLPQYCTHCCRQGHGENNCHILHPEMRHSIGQRAKLGDVQRGQEERSSARAEGTAGAQRREKEEVQQQGSLKGPADAPNGPEVRSSLGQGTVGSQQHGVEELQQKVSLGEEATLQQEEHQPQVTGVGLQPVTLQALEMGCSEMATGPAAGVGVGCTLGLFGKDDANMGSVWAGGAAMEQEQVCTARLEKGDGVADEVAAVQRQVGNLSPRGGGVMVRIHEGSSSSVAGLNLDPVVSSSSFAQEVDGLGKAGVAHAPNLSRLRKLIKLHSLQLVVVVEPKTGLDNRTAIRLRLGMDYCLSNQEGSVWVFYQSLFACQCIGESSQHLTIQVRSHLFPTPIHLSCIHAKCTEHEREILWHDLLSDNSGSYPWFLVGDFNMITNGEEKRGGLPFRPLEGVDFLNFMSEAGVVDAGFSGSRYTWCNNRPGPARIWKRLDRLLLNGTALGMPHQVTVQHLGRDPSDHAPLLLSVVTRLDNKPRPFRFLNVWTMHEDFLGVVRECWAQPVGGSPMQVLASKLRAVKQVLRQWSKLKFGDIFETVRVAESELVDVETKYDLDPSDALRNSKFFHSVVAERRRRSVIHRVRGSDGEWLDEEARIGEAAVTFFQELFTAETVLPATGLLENIPSLVSAQDNVILTEIPRLEEVKDIVFALDEESTAGPDGFTGKFFTFAWEVVAMDVYQAVVSFFCGAEIPRNFMATSIVLLPKVEHPQDFTQFRPISLCNFANKIISKLLSERLAKILPRLISPQQSGFVKGRQIADNFLLAQELVSDITRSNRGGNVVIKLDMMKAYDRVSWPFLLQVLRRFGFSETWIDMIWRLVSNVWFSVLVNGAPQGFFKSSRGLRQGDPISPALFVLGAEVLSRTLNTVASQRQFVPFKVPPRCPVITHLAYADDVIIFSSGARSSLNLIKRVLEGFPAPKAAVIGQVLGFQRRPFPVKYLGCPLYVGRRKKIYFADVYNAVVARILSWKHKLLSVGGRVVLIQSVLASMPVHLLTAASPPKGVIVALERVFADFLWGTSGFGTRFHWIRWEALCRPREEGWIGLRGLKDVHDSFSVKLWWNFRQQASLWAEFMAGKYCAGLHPCLAEASQRGSLTWKRISSVQQVAEDSISWVVNAGLMDFWHDNWLGTGALCQKVEIFHDHLVADFVDCGAWNIVMLNQYLDAGSVANVLAMDPPTFQDPDRMVWALTPSGSFSTESAYSLVRQGGHRSWSAAAIWHQCIPLKISFFMLRLMQHRLPTMDRLRGAGVQGPSRCWCCLEPRVEDLDHIFCAGEGAKRVWRHFEMRPGEMGPIYTARHMIWLWWIRSGNTEVLKCLYRILPAVVCWELWRALNRGVFEGQRLKIRATVTRIVQLLGELLRTRFPWVRFTSS